MTEEQKKARNSYMRAYMKKYRVEKADRLHKTKNKLQKKWRIENRNKIRQYEKSYAEKHPEKIKAKQERHKLIKYGITPEQYDVMLSNQNGVCAICGLLRGTKKLAVDHDHTTGKIRGLLCQFCNTALGKFLDSKEILNNAILYVEKYKHAGN